ncbi:MAG: CARDB domain-containing protein [Candidatus Micrarchaeota archaeon]
MKEKFVFAMILLLGFGFAASSGAILRVSDINSTPQDVYAGTFGYVTFNVDNSGGATAGSVNVYYTLDGTQKYAAVGDIATSSSAQVSVPFRVGNDTGGTIQLQTISVYYYDGDSTSQKKTSISYPITVKNLNAILITTPADQAISAAPGEKISFKINVKSVEKGLNNVVIKSADGTKFSILGSDHISLGAISAAQDNEVEVQFLADSNLTPGRYNIPIVAEYQNSLNQLSQQTMYVGPVNIISATQQYRISLVPQGTTEVGSQVPFKLTVENTGSEASSVSVQIAGTDQFTPVGIQTLYFDSIGPGSRQSKDLDIGISPSISSGYYSLPITLASESGGSGNYVAGIVVQASAQLRITLNTAGTTPSIQVANTGNTNIRSVYVTVKSQSGQTLAESLIGTLNVDDFDYVDLSGSPGGNLVVQVAFKDNNNQEHTIEQSVEASGLGAFSLDANATENYAGGAANGTRSFAGRGGAGGLMQITNVGRNANWADLVIYVLGGIAIVAGGYYAYKKYYVKGKK